MHVCISILLWIANLYAHFHVCRYIYGCAYKNIYAHQNICIYCFMRISINICAYPRVYIYFYTYKYVHMNVDMYIHIYMYLFSYIFLYMYVCIYIYIYYICTYTYDSYIQICMYIYIYLNVCIYIYIHVNRYIHKYINTYIHIYGSWTRLMVGNTNTVHGWQHISIICHMRRNPCLGSFECFPGEIYVCAALLQKINDNGSGLKPKSSPDYMQQMYTNSHAYIYTHNSWMCVCVCVCVCVCANSTSAWLMSLCQWREGGWTVTALNVFITLSCLSHTHTSTYETVDR